MCIPWQGRQESDCSRQRRSNSRGSAAIWKDVHVWIDRLLRLLPPTAYFCNHGKVLNQESLRMKQCFFKLLESNDLTPNQSWYDVDDVCMNFPAIFIRDLRKMNFSNDSETFLEMFAHESTGLGNVHHQLHALQSWSGLKDAHQFFVCIFGTCEGKTCRDQSIDHDMTIRSCVNLHLTIGFWICVLCGNMILFRRLVWRAASKE